VTLFDAQIMSHSVTTPDRDGSRSCDFNLLLFDNLSPMSILIVTDCHNLVLKKIKRNSLFLNHFRIVWNLTGNELPKNVMGVFIRNFEVKPWKVPRYCFVPRYWLQVTFTAKRYSRIHSILTHQPLSSTEWLQSN